MKVPPHLPPPACNVAAHQSWQRLKVLVIGVLFGLLAGIAGASVVLAWIWPGYGGGDTWIVAQQNRVANSQNQLDSRARAEITEKIISVYNVGDSGDSFSLRAQNKLGDALILSSDGWLVLFTKSSIANFRNWRVLTSVGSVFELENALSDPRTGLVFLKVSLSEDVDRQRASGQFKVVSFADNIDINNELYIWQDGNWQYSWTTGIKNGEFGLPQLDAGPHLAYSLRYNFSLGSVAINNQGRVVGLVTSDGSLLPLYYITRLMSPVLEKQKVTYRTLGVSGWFDSEQPIVVKNERQPGFYVSSVLNRKSTLRVGDVVTAVDGKVVVGADLWYDISGKSTVKLQVLRSGKTVELNATVLDI